MPNYLRAKCVLPQDSGIPEDASMNTFHFIGTAATRIDSVNAIFPQLATFYQTFDGTIYPTSVNTPMTVTWYDLADPQPRAPLQVDTITIAPSAFTSLPGEVALCLSFKGAAVSGVAPARRRGRVYLGPLATSVAEYVGNRVRVTTAARDLVRTAANQMRIDVGVTGNSWCIYSPTTDATSSLPDSFVPVTSGWVDDAFDTQRRRGSQATARSVFP